MLSRTLQTIENLDEAQNLLTVFNVTPTASCKSWALAAVRPIEQTRSVENVNSSTAVVPDAA